MKNVINLKLVKFWLFLCIYTLNYFVQFISFISPFSNLMFVTKKQNNTIHYIYIYIYINLNLDNNIMIKDITGLWSKKFDQKKKRHHRANKKLWETCRFQSGRTRLLNETRHNNLTRCFFVSVTCVSFSHVICLDHSFLLSPSSSWKPQILVMHSFFRFVRFLIVLIVKLNNIR